MKNLTIKQRLLSMTVILAVLITALSFFFINRFGAMANTYNQIPSMHVPQEQVTAHMLQLLTNEQILISQMMAVDRDVEAFRNLATVSDTKLEEFNILTTALLNGNDNLGEKINKLQGVSIPPVEKDGEIESLVKKAGNQFAAYKGIADQIISKKREQLELSNTIGWYDDEENSKGMVKDVVETRIQMKNDATDYTVKFLIDEISGYEKSIINDPDDEIINRYNEIIASSMEMFGSINSINEDRDGPNPLKVYDEKFSALIVKLKAFKSISEEIAGIKDSFLDKNNTLIGAVEKIKDNAHLQIVSATTSAIQMERSAKTIISIIALLVITFGLIFGWMVSSGINKALSKIIKALGESSEQVASASTQVSSSSQSMSEGSSEQAASIEETSSSLEEMSSMTKQNADHASEANNLMQDANKVVQEANYSMNNLISSMEDISKASDETSKIIKTIDEIAFQTNLLALNAAVEAARAGEAGAGFAVVADEVRNLAMRAADAAKSTSMLIEGTVKKIKEGSELVSKTNDAFKHVSESSTKVGELVAEIAAASNEQAQGIEQVNKAVTEMDKVVQQNAATSEETASASQEMNSQSEQMRSMVKEMVLLIGGGMNGNENGNGNGKVYQKALKTIKQYREKDADSAHFIPERIENGNGKRSVSLKKNTEINPEQVIPFDDNELHNF